MFELPEFITLTKQMNSTLPGKINLQKETSVTNILLIVASIALMVHGLIHLMGTTAYLKLATLHGLPYKTTLLGGRWELGEAGMAVYGLLWAVAAIGFVIAATALWSGWEWWSVGLMGVTLFSLVLTALDWDVGYAGVMINLVILILVWIGPLLTR